MLRAYYGTSYAETILAYRFNSKTSTTWIRFHKVPQIANEALMKLLSKIL